MDIFEQLLEARNKHLAVSLCMVIDTHGSTPRHAGSKMLVYEDGHTTGTVGGGEVENRVIQEGAAAIKDGKTRRLSYSMTDPAHGDVGVCGGQVEVYVEPILPQPRLVVVGGGHVGKALAHLGHWLGFRVAVSDDRVELCTPEENPDADEFYPVAMADLPAHLPVDARTYLVLTTRGMVVDVPGLPALLDTPAAYIGVIGSRRRWSMTRKSLLEAGIAAEKLDRVVAPIGLELHAETPEEIAVSIMAEIMLLRNGGSGQRMKM